VVEEKPKKEILINSVLNRETNDRRLFAIMDAYDEK
jgi:hypothetical protein